MREEVHQVEAVHQRLASVELADVFVVEFLCQMWRRLSAALSPIIGVSGVRALLRRSVLLNKGGHAWLAPVPEGGPESDTVERLCAALSSQSRERATAGDLAVLRTFHDLLVGLIGESLTERLLQSVLVSPSAGPAVQDPLP